ncbi:GNAT family N-acetyltransferase [Streptomyces chryseus]|uniref:GNAT family N-acetyltransferase n=1 Tax=Streptomyces chryseus TaxID=68186 RepID=UPI00110FD185|nr:GNAT family N-acetyltransferase [Streptomyces chryseus]GGX07965.1 GCN5 family N-acetyltransferase [Streptomyces chryseus]
MAAIADDEPPAVALLAGYRRAGRAWVAADAADHPAACLIWDVVDGAAHIEQVSVHRRASRQGVGRALITHLAHVAAAQEGLAALTLTTFADVPWNAPYHARTGFRPLSEAELTDGLRRIRREEAAHGLDRRPRVCMRREL